MEIVWPLFASVTVRLPEGGGTVVIAGWVVAVGAVVETLVGRLGGVVTGVGISVVGDTPVTGVALGASLPPGGCAEDDAGCEAT